MYLQTDFLVMKYFSWDRNKHKEITLQDESHMRCTWIPRYMCKAVFKSFQNISEVRPLKKSIYF